MSIFSLAVLGWTGLSANEGAAPRLAKLLAERDRLAALVARVGDEAAMLAANEDAADRERRLLLLERQLGHGLDALSALDKRLEILASSADLPISP